MAGAIAGKEADSALADGTTSDTLQQKAPAAAAPRRRFRMRIATALMLAFGALVFVGVAGVLAAVRLLRWRLWALRGRPEAAILGHSADELVPHDAAAVFLANDRRAIEAGGAFGICMPDMVTVDYLWPFIQNDYSSEEAALAGGVFGFLQGILFIVIVPLMGEIKPNERVSAIGLSLFMIMAGTLAGAGLSAFTASQSERRRAKEAQGL